MCIRDRSNLERIDKIIASQGQYSRKEVKALIAKERVAVDGTPVKSSSDKADPAVMQITIDGKPLDFKRHVYLMLNKPQGYVSATEDREDVYKRQVMILLLLYRLRRAPLKEFFATVVLCGFVEYFTSYFMEAMYQTRWWDYSCLLYTSS